MNNVHKNGYQSLNSQHHVEIFYMLSFFNVIHPNGYSNGVFQKENQREKWLLCLTQELLIGVDYLM